jgi:glycosyltransferase involved in cell wall biosynthesis
VHVASITSHPIQYQTPLWRELGSKLEHFDAFFLTDHGINRSFDREFGQAFAWDLDMLGGYNSKVLNCTGSFDMRKFGGVCLPPNFKRDLAQSYGLIWIEGWRYKGFVDAIRICSRNNVPFVIRGESNLLAPHSRSKLIAKRLVLSLLLRRAAAFLCIGSENRKFYRWLGFDETVLLDAPYFVDNDRFEAQSDLSVTKRVTIRERWGISRHAKVLLFCGKLIDKKHPDHLVEAVSLLQQQSPNEEYHILFVGNGGLRDELTRKCRVLFDAWETRRLGNLEDCSNKFPRASFAGFLNQTEIVEAYVASDVIVLPSDAGETWGLVVNEAMASGIPAVVSNLVGCALDLPGKLDPRAIYPYGNISNLAHSIQSILNAGFERKKIQSIAASHHMRKTVECFLRFLDNYKKANL